MTTIKEFKEWLSQFPEDTIVEVSIQQPSRGYESYGCIEFASPNLENGDGWEFLDFRNNKFVKENYEHFGKCFLRLGEPL